jgi:hypothetical protein
MTQWLEVCFCGGTKRAFTLALKAQLLIVHNSGGQMTGFKLKQTLAAATVALGSIGAANAAIVIQSGDFKMTIDLYDSATTGYTSNCGSVAACDAASGIVAAPGSVGSVNTSADTMGIFSIASITRLSNDTQWFTRGVNGYLTGVFGNLTDYNVTVGANETTANAIGGTFDVYFNATNYDSSLGPVVGAGKDLNGNLYPGITSGELWLSGIFVPGVLFGDETTTFSTTYNNLSTKGVSSGYLDVTGGKEFDAFNKDSVVDMNGVKRDLSATFTYQPQPIATANGWTVQSTGEIIGEVPEPGALALIALAMIGAGAATTRRKAA